MRLDDRRVVLGVSGGIAAYKAVELCRRLVDAGAFVSPVLTDAATRFVGPLTFSALASERARTSLYDDPDPIPHTTLGRAADLVIVAPATARVLGSMAHGISDDLLTATLLATAAPVLVCPAMHTEMWEHQATQDNLALLRSRGVAVVEPTSGRLAGGDSGSGRMAEPSDIVFAAEALVGPRDLDGVSVLVTAGGTREPIDAVRVITNRSSGKQGTAIAAEAAARGAKVTLVTTARQAVPAGVEVVAVETAFEMQGAVVPRAPGADVVIMAAAVADQRVARPSGRKTKKGEAPAVLELEPTHDFLVDLGRTKPPAQVLVGFAAETDDVEANAAQKLKRKQLDMIVANDVSSPGAGFDHDTNEVLILGADGSRQAVPMGSKRDIAAAVLDAVSACRERIAGGAARGAPHGKEATLNR
ncbi:MAG TPA: bifunctional phosphopantothenoylcysteine decarboxylase/phosphopantothenate--cysteine ligase CoaBC [Acidimicrobiales bacterium]|nr:bifunctional phosphopantothenoylcysteine decarboxylase/phosphopantothenate--cysteine ligase CoaBC [Acidimicrobiales bacterium]